MNKREELTHQKGADPVESKVYDQLFSLLERPPGVALPNDFPKSVIQKLQNREKTRRFWFYFLSSLGTLFSLAATLSILTYYFGTEGLSKLMDATGWAVFVGLSIVVIQYFDQKLIRKKGLNTI